MDSAGIRALVRGHSSAQRLGGSLRLAAPEPAVSRVFDLAHLTGVFEIYPSVDGARIAAWPWRTIRIATAGAVLCTALVWAGLRWPVELTGIGEAAEEVLAAGGKKAAAIPMHPVQPFIELLKPVVASPIGLLRAAIHQPAGA